MDIEESQLLKQESISKEIKFDDLFEFIIPREVIPRKSFINQSYKHPQSLPK